MVDVCNERNTAELSGGVDMVLSLAADLLVVVSFFFVFVEAHPIPLRNCCVFVFLRLGALAP